MPQVWHSTASVQHTVTHKHTLRSNTQCMFHIAEDLPAQYCTSYCFITAQTLTGRVQRIRSCLRRPHRVEHLVPIHTSYTHKQTYTLYSDTYTPHTHLIHTQIEIYKHTHYTVTHIGEFFQGGFFSLGVVTFFVTLRADLEDYFKCKT